jgi:hypothetical protein
MSPLKRWSVTYTTDGYPESTRDVVAPTRSAARMQVARSIGDVRDNPMGEILRCLTVRRNPMPTPPPLPDRLVALAASLSESDLGLMRHALTGGSGREYRNRYSASIGGAADLAWVRLATLGLAARGVSVNGERDHSWHVTADGREVFAARAERVL